MVVKIVAISAVALILLIALIVGLVKGFTKTKTWATEYLFAVILSVLIYSLADLSGMKAWLAFALKIGTAVVFILVFALLSSRGKALIENCIANARKRSYYEQYGEREENVLQILDAIELGDEKAYKRLTRRQFPENRGGAGVADRICGGITLMIKAAVILGLIAAAAFVVLDLTQLPFVTEKLGGIYESGAWQFFSRFVMDAFVIGILFFAIRAGFRSGVISVLWVIVILGMIGGSAYLSYWLSFNNASFIATAQSLANGALGGLSGSIAEVFNNLGMSNVTDVTVCQLVLTAALSLVLIIVSVVIGAIVGSIIGRARDGAAFSVIDGVFGAVIAFAVACGVMLLLGAVFYSISDLDMMSAFNDYMYYTASDGTVKPAAIASAFYTNNPLNSLEFIRDLPVRGWFD